MSGSGSAVGQSAPDVRADSVSFVTGGDILPEGGVVPNPLMAPQSARPHEHEWRLVEERHATTEVYHQPGAPGYGHVSGSGLERRWYCVHCRTFETTVHALVSDERGGKT